MKLAALHDAERPVAVADGPPQGLGAVDHEQHPPVGPQPAGHQVVEQAAGDGRRLGRALAQTEHVFAPLGIDAQRDHDAVFPEDLAVDADHPQVQRAQRPADECLARSPPSGRRGHDWPGSAPTAQVASLHERGVRGAVSRRIGSRYRDRPPKLRWTPESGQPAELKVVSARTTTRRGAPCSADAPSPAFLPVSIVGSSGSSCQDARVPQCGS